MRTKTDMDLEDGSILMYINATVKFLRPSQASIKRILVLEAVKAIT